MLALLSLLAANVSARGDVRPIVGHVLDLNGDWFLHSSGTGDVQSQKLGKWQDLPARAVVRVKSPLPDGYITIVDQRLQLLIERSCRVVSRCSQPIYLPKSANEQAGTDVFALALRQVWALLSGGEYERSMHRMRGAVLFSEGVAPLHDGRLDLGEAMHGIGKGRYVLAACKEEASCGQEENRDARDMVAFDWKPESDGIVTVGDRRPGLYEVSSGAGSDQGGQGLNISGLKVSARILICAPQSYPLARDAFRTTRSLAQKWESAAADETAHSFLRAYLAQLARADVCAS